MKFTLVLLFTLTVGLSAAFLRRSDAVAPDAVQDVSQRGPVHMIRFVISEDGLYPRRMQVDHGLLNVVLDDKTGKSEALLIDSLTGDQRTRVNQVSRGLNQQRGRALVRLPPGRYLISDSNQPNHTAELIVNP